MFDIVVNIIYIIGRIRKPFLGTVAIIMGLSIVQHASATPSPPPKTVNNNQSPATAGIDWKTLDDGLLLGEAGVSPQNANKTPTAILKINTLKYSLKLLAISEVGGKALTAKDWANKYNLAAVINAGMYQTDGITHVGFMKNKNHLNNPQLNRYAAFIAFDPLEETLPPALIIDRECHDFDGLKLQYGTVIQNIRMISCRGQNVWAQQADNRWIVAAFGLDGEANAFFIFSGAPYTVHDFIELLLQLPLSLVGAVYLEGGSDASLFISSGTVRRDYHGGGYEEGRPAAVPSFAQPLPNVIGIVKRK